MRETNGNRGGPYNRPSPSKSSGPEWQSYVAENGWDALLELLGGKPSEVGSGVRSLPVQGGYEGFMQQRSSTGETTPAPQKVAPQVTFRPKPGAEGNNGDDLDALFAELMTAINSGGSSIDYESALAESEKAIRQAYAADIAAIRAGNKGARRDTAKNRAALEQMYGGLAKQYRRESGRAVKHGEQAANRINKNAEGSSKFLTGQAKDLLGEQAALAEGLGIEAAIPAAQEGLMKETLGQQKDIIREGSQDANRQRGFAGNNQRFLQRGGVNARLEGSNRSADLLADLQDYLQQGRSQIAGLRGDMNREIASNSSNLMGQVAELQASADSEMWDRLMQMAGLKMDIETEQFDQSRALADFQSKLSGEPADSMPGAENFQNSQYYLEQLRRPKVGAGIFDEILQRPEFLYGKAENPNTGEMYKLTPEYAMQMIEQAAQENNLSPQDVNLLRLAIATYMG